MAINKIIVKLILILLLAGCSNKQEDPLKEMKSPVIITKIDNTSGPQVTVKDASGKEKIITDSRLANFNKVGDTIK